MTFYELWIYVAELILGEGNYTIIQGIGDLAFGIMALVLIAGFFLLPFAVFYVVFAFIRSLKWGRL